MNCNEHEVLESYSCDHEEADSRIFFHVARATQTYAPRGIIIWSIDTDVASMCPKAVHLLNLQQLFFKTGVKDKKRFIPMHDIAERVRSEISQILPLLHAATGCDSTSAFASHGKTQHLKLLMMISIIPWKLDSLSEVTLLSCQKVLFRLSPDICHIYTQETGSTAI